jgi:hypothetical protein
MHRLKEEVMWCKKLRRTLAFASVAMLMLAPVSCRDGELTTNLTVDDEAAIYAAVTRQLATVDDTFGGNLKPPTLYVIRNTDDKAGNPGGQQSKSALISHTVQSRIVAALADLPTEVIWIDKFGDAEFEDIPGSMVKNRGAIITLGNVYRQADGSVYVAGSIYIADTGAGGTTYILEKTGGVWVITGSTGVSWIR